MLYRFQNLLAQFVVALSDLKKLIAQFAVVLFNLLFLVAQFAVVLFNFKFLVAKFVIVLFYFRKSLAEFVLHLVNCFLNAQLWLINAELLLLLLNFTGILVNGIEVRLPR